MLGETTVTNIYLLYMRLFVCTIVYLYMCVTHNSKKKNWKGEGTRSMALKLISVWRVVPSITQSIQLNHSTLN